MPAEVFGVAPWVVVTALVTWVAAVWKARQDRKKDVDDRGDRLEIHKDELTFEILRNARQEVISTRLEMDEVRFENRKLRRMETHFFHFQQSLDHLEALLSANTEDELKLARRNARAFLNRMRRLNEAKGTIANEIQRLDSATEHSTREIDDLKNEIFGKDQKDG